MDGWTDGSGRISDDVTLTLSVAKGRGPKLDDTPIADWYDGVI